MFPEESTQRPQEKIHLVGDMLGVDLKKGPSRARTAYQLYSTAHCNGDREANPNATGKEVSDILKTRFRVEMDETERWPWEEQARNDKARYALQLAESESGADNANVRFMWRSNLPCGSERIFHARARSKNT